MLRIIVIIMVVAIIELHVKISENKHWFPGAILPLICIILAIYELVIMKSSLKSPFMTDLLLVFCTSVLLWIYGRYNHRKKELNRMKAQDIIDSISSSPAKK